MKKNSNGACRSSLTEYGKGVLLGNRNHHLYVGDYHTLDNQFCEFIRKRYGTSLVNLVMVGGRLRTLTSGCQRSYIALIVANNGHTTTS